MSFKDNWDDNKPKSYLEQIVSMKRKTFVLTNGIYVFIGFSLFYIFLS
jgi:hypothetical protein